MAAPPPNVQHVIVQAARRWGVDPTVLSNLLRQESGYRENVGSKAGARDIAQFMPATAKAYGVTLGDNRITDDVFGAAHYLADNLKRTGGSYAQALSIYNSGSPTGYQRIPETRNYVQSILGGVKPGRYTPSGGGMGGMSGTVTPGQVRGGGFNTGPAGGSQLAGLLGQLQQPQPVQTMMPAPPATSANRYLRTAQGYGGGFGSVSTAAQPRADVSSVLQALASQPGQGIPSASVGGARTSVTGVTGPGGKTGTGPARGGIAKFAGTPVAGWIAPILAYARQHGWQGTVTSGYRSYAQQKSIYDRGVRPAAKPGTSNHEFTAYPGGAVDVSDAQALARILANSPYRGKLVWAGGKDPVHFSHPHNGGY